MEKHFKELAEVIKAENVTTAFHLAEENKEEFPHENVSVYLLTLIIR